MPTSPGIVPALPTRSAAGMSSEPQRSALVTGAGGFAGQWLCRHLIRCGWRVTGAAIDGEPVGSVALSATERASVTWLRADLRDGQAVRASVDAARPDAVFHLAGVSSIPAAGKDPFAALNANAGIAVQLLDAVRQRRAAQKVDPVVLIVGSAEQYGVHDATELPLAETAECRPQTFYGASKLAQEVLALAAFREDGVRTVCTRSFNHSGYGQNAAFLIPALVTRAMALRTSASPTLELGALHPVRDFLHVEDAIAAYVALVERGAPGEVYNVASGQGASVGDLAREVLAACGVEAQLSSVAPLVRRTEVPVLVGRNDKLRSATGWAPTRTRADIIHDLIHAATH